MPTAPLQQLSTATRSPSPANRLLRLAMGHITARAIHVCAALGVADIIGDQPKTVAEIAAVAQVDADALERVLRLLASEVGVLTLDAAGRYALTELGRVLRGQPSSPVRELIASVGSAHDWASVGALVHAVRTGECAFEHVHGAKFFDYLSSHPDDAAIFDRAMNGSSDMGATAVLRAYDFSACRRVIDVGGGKGALLTAIIKRYPLATGVLCDSPNVVAHATVPEAIADRYATAPCDFFAAVPAGGDLYLLRRVLHDWDDERALAILRRCREAILPTGRIVIIELAAPDGDAPSQDWAISDVVMMLMVNGRERTSAQLERLLRAAGFAMTRVVRTLSPLWMVEAMPVANN